MTKAKLKGNSTNGTNKGNTGGVGTAPNGNAGKNGGDTKQDGSIAGPPASEPVAGTNDSAPNGTGGGDNGARDPSLDAPEQPKPKRGRHVADCPCPKCAERRATGPSPKASKAGLVINNKGWAEKFYGVHQLAATFLPIPDPSRPGKMLLSIEMEQSQAICDRAYVVAAEFDLLKYFAPDRPVSKRWAIASFAATMGFVYVPKVMVLRAMMQAAQAANMQAATSTMSAADMMNPQPGATPSNDTQDPGHGIYQYG